MLQTLYKIASSVLAKRAPAYLEKRLELGKEDALRISERYGIASHEKPAGTLLWIHAASVGEARSVIELIHAISQKQVSWHVLVTTGTLSSARIILKEIPDNTIHQYYPLDAPAWVRAFLDYWQPDAVVWVEQEIWPNMLYEIHARQIPAILANGRLTENSFKRWLWLKSFVKDLLAPFKHIYAQSAKDGERYEILSGRPVITKGNLKYAAAPLPYHPVTLDMLKIQIGGRPIWLASSTHLGEEFVIAEAHKLILNQQPEALLIIVPRHPDRGDQIIQDLNETNLSVSRRSEAEPILPDTQVYLADTFSELGLFYRLSRIAFIGGSLVPVGGHNIIEAAQLNCATLYGSHMHNFQEIRDLFEQNQVGITCTTAQELAMSVIAYMGNPEMLEAVTQKALSLMEKEGAVLQDLIKDVENLILEKKSDANEQLRDFF